jgi:hypothetical protein
MFKANDVVWEPILRFKPKPLFCNTKLRHSRHIIMYFLFYYLWARFYSSFLILLRFILFTQKINKMLPLSVMCLYIISKVFGTYWYAKKHCILKVIMIMHCDKYGCHRFLNYILKYMFVVQTHGFSSISTLIMLPSATEMVHNFQQKKVQPCAA